MKVTDEEARDKMCPLTINSPLGLQPCGGTNCMGWEWIGWRDIATGAVFIGPEPRCEDDERVGTCEWKRRSDA